MHTWLTVLRAIVVHLVIHWTAATECESFIGVQKLVVSVEMDTGSNKLTVKVCYCAIVRAVMHHTHLRYVCCLSV
jgi:hypothetical protein